MTTFNIEQAKGMVGMVLLRIEVKIKHLYPREQKTGAKGTWFQQKGYIQDSTGEMVVVFNDLPDQSSLVGKQVIFKSTTGPKGVHGVQVKSWQGKKGANIELVITKTALIVGSEEEPNVSLAEPSVRMPMTAMEVAKNERITACDAVLNREDRKVGIGIAKNRITQYHGLYDLCWTMALKLGEQRGETEPTLIKDIATTFFIQGMKDGLGDKMLVRTTSKFYNEDAIQPASATHRGEPTSFDGDSGSNDSEQPF